MNRALPLIALCAACSLRAPRITESVPCSSSLECGRSDICFLGECRPHAASLALVSAEVRPPNDSPFGQLQVASIDLHASALNDFMLQPLFAANGTVSQDPDLPGSATPVPGASVMFTQHPAVIPDRVELFPGVTDNGGAFLVWLPQGMWNVLVVPPSPLPPYRPATLDTTASPSLDYHLVTRFVSRGGVMLDPFGGVGTIPFEGALHGIATFSFEISPAALHISRAKLGLPKWTSRKAATRPNRSTVRTTP